MSTAALAEPQIVHTLPGRVRVHLPGWEGEGQRGLESRLRQLQGVVGAQANALTSNVLVRFDPARTSAGAILTALETLTAEAIAGGRHDGELPHVLHERSEGHHQGMRRARIAVRGMDRDPGVLRRVVESLEHQPGVRHVHASPLTGRVLIEYEEHRQTIEDLLGCVARVELPDVAGEDTPRHPLDPGPLFQSAARTAGAALGLGLLAATRLTGSDIPPGTREGAGRAAAVIGILQGFPFIRKGLRRLLGRDRADLVFYVPSIAILTLAGSPLGLAVTGAEAVRLLTEVVARRGAFRRYEERLETAARAHPGAVVRVESGERVPLDCAVIEGFGTASAVSGLPCPVEPGQDIPSGARLYGGPFVVELKAGEPFPSDERPAPIAATLYDRYLRLLSPLSLGYAALTALLTRSVSRTFQALLLVNSRPALIGRETADTGASARVLRAGVTVVGTRPDRTVRLPDVLLLDAPRTLTDGFEVGRVVPLHEGLDADGAAALAAGISAAAGAPWGGAFAGNGGVAAEHGSFDGHRAVATSEGVRHTLGPAHQRSGLPAALRLRHRGEHVLLLSREGEEGPLAAIVLRPRLAAGVSELVETCRRHGVELALLGAGHLLAAQTLGERAGIPVLPDVDAVQAVRARQENGAIVALASDNAGAAAAFHACDLAVGVTSGRTSHFPARADYLAPDMHALTAIVEAGARRNASVRDAVVLSAASNVFGVVWGLRGAPGIMRASYGIYVASLAAIADGWLWLRGGGRPWSSVARLVDPRPERWGRRSVADVLRILHTGETGLSSAQAGERRQVEPALSRRNGVLSAILDQIRSPLTAVLAAGATLSVVLGSVVDLAMIGATMVANVAVGAWQERQADQAIEALERIGTSTGRVLRDGQPVVIPAAEIVPGDILVLAPGDRVAADARVISSQSLEVDEAALTGESFPVSKAPTNGTDASRIVLAGSDVTVGTGRAVVVAVGRRTRMGATAAALALDETRQSPLGMRLNRMLRIILPLAAAGGAVVFASGLLRMQPALAQFAIAASIAVAAVPEGLPLLAGVGEAAVARRLAGHRALVRRLSAIEALGRVDVACTDKTGTLTEGKLALHLIASMDHEAGPTDRLSDDLHRVLVAGGLATPHPDAPGAAAHPTDVAVIDGTRSAGLGDELQVERDEELPFDPARSFHAARVGGRLFLKGAAEALEPRCERALIGGKERPLDRRARQALLARADALSGQGLRVLMVAEGPPEASLEDPGGLLALGFLGISDPLRPEVAEAVRRCHDAGVRVIMLTGDHPETSRAIGYEAGLLGPGDELLTGSDITELGDDDLDRRLERATVVARVTPLDKLRIVESLQRRGHTVAMTGDGVNDAPALRLADVGVAMGQHGTEVARQAADVVLADDNFSTLVEALVEGRSFWRNIRRALALLLGGNLGELGLVVGASVLGLASPLLTHQILAVNLVTDVLPSLAVALQPPETRNLTGLAREGTSALDVSLRRDVWRRGAATAAPALAAFLLTLPRRGLPEARTVAFASVVMTQLAQTLDAGRTEGSLNRAVSGAVAGSVGVMLAALTVPPVRSFLSLVTPGPLGWALIGASSLVAVLLGRGLSTLALPRAAPRLLPAPAPAGA